jgi:magnesium transporter
MDRARSEDVALVEKLAQTSDFESLDRFLDSLHPADVADILQELEPELQVTLLKRLDDELAAEVLTEVDQQSGQALLLLLSDRDVVSLVAEMPSDDAADIMSALPPEKSERVEALLSSEDREQLHELMEFGEDTAGGIMEVERIAVREDATIRDAVRLAREGAEEIENLQKIYVVSENGELIGYLELLDLLVYPRATVVTEAMKKIPVAVPVDMDQEAVASLFGKYDEFTLPVVDGSGKLVGRITVDDIIDVIEEEASEDIAHIAGTTDVELGETSPVKISRTRLPWLITGLFGQVIAALIMSRYEHPLREMLVLTFFVPLIVGTAGSIGIQAAVVVVRELALGQIDIFHAGRRVARELLVAFINGAILGSLLFGIVVLWQHDIRLATLLLGSLLTVIFVAAFIGASVPLVLEKWKIDPAIATGPFITVSNDIIGLAIYLSMATAYLSRFS